MTHGRRHTDRWSDAPFEVSLAAGALGCGIWALATQVFPIPLDAKLPIIFLWLWAGMVFVGSAMIATGLIGTPRLTSALALRRAGLILIGGALITYSPAIVLYGAAHAVVPGILIGAYAAGAWWQAWLLHLEEARIMRLTREIEKDLDDYR